MSIKVPLNPTRRREVSAELDVFEATEYFSSCNEIVGYNGVYLSQKAVKEEGQADGGRRMSLDVHASISLPSHSHRLGNVAKKEKQILPSSPGGRLSKFLKTLFRQTASKKKKSMSSTTHYMKGEEEMPDAERRKRRSSMSLFESMKTADSKLLYASSTASGFRTPPPYVNPSVKIYKDLRSCSDHKHVVSLPKYSGNYVNSVPSKEEALDGKKHMDLAWLNEKFNLIDGFSMKDGNMIRKNRIWVSQEKKNVEMSIEVDDGGESDSSSDLFELENHDLSAR